MHESSFLLRKMDSEGELILRFPFLVEECLDPEDERWLVCADALPELMKYASKHKNAWRARHNVSVALMQKDPISSVKV